MKKLIKKLETIYAAVAYAEDGDKEMARKLMEEIRKEKQPRKIGRVERIMMAITFAEAGEEDIAIEIMRKGEEEQKEKRVRASKKIKPRKQLKERVCGCKKKNAFVVSPRRLVRV